MLLKMNIKLSWNLVLLLSQCSLLLAFAIIETDLRISEKVANSWLYLSEQESLHLSCFADLQAW